MTAWAVCTDDRSMAALRPTEPTATPTCTEQMFLVLSLRKSDISFVIESIDALRSKGSEREVYLLQPSAH